MIIGSYNVENLFRRARAMNQETWQDGREVLSKFSALNVLLGNAVYSTADKVKILELLKGLGLGKADESTYVILRQNRGRLLKRPKTGPAEVVAGGRGDWIGWLELKTESVNEIATQMTAKVIKDVNADVLAVIEAEDRTALKKLNEQLLAPVQAGYDNIMLIDGNDERGIDVGLLCRAGFAITQIVSHVDDTANGNAIFSRDCPEYQVEAPDGKRLLVMINHLKSKGYGSSAASNARRKAQATRVREIYQQRRAQGVDEIVILGDFNDTPDSDPLTPLLKAGSDLKDVTEHPAFQGDGRPGTFANGTASNKIDYLLMSPAVFARVNTGGIFRKGVWGGTNGTLFPHYLEMTKAIHAGSDHAAIWAEIAL